LRPTPLSTPINRTLRRGGPLGDGSGDSDGKMEGEAVMKSLGSGDAGAALGCQAPAVPGSVTKIESAVSRATSVTYPA